MAIIGKNKASRGCWTCKDRRVRCDRSVPGCANCARLGHKCQGYGLRLSWPRDGDTRRSMTAETTSVFPMGPRNGGDIELVHTSYFHIDMYNYLVELRSSNAGSEVSPQPANLILPVPCLMPRPAHLNAEELELLQYFQSTAYLTLATFSRDRPGLRDILVRMALNDHTIPSRAVLHAILGVSSLHRDGMQLQCAKHKTAAVGALRASAKKGIDTISEAAQHVAANMLLCTYEIHIGNDMHAHWMWYLIGARDIIRTSDLEDEIARIEIFELVMWTFYHDVLARFTLFHWRRGSVASFFAREIGAEEGWQRDLCGFVTKLKLNLSPLETILRFLGDSMDALCKSASSPGSPIEPVQAEIHGYEQAIRKVQPSAGFGNEAAIGLDELSDMFRTAGLVYLARACEDLFGESRGDELTTLVADGFARLERVTTCERFFPLFILGCEANTDERRMLILNLLRRTEETTSVRNLEWIRYGLCSTWVQDDLHADQDVTLNYVNKLNVVIGSSPTLPTMV